MKRISFVIFAFIFIANTFGQNISISSFKLLDKDLTANTAGTMELDQNGETAALIKVVTTQTGFTFDSGSLGIVKTKQTPGEVWVYIPRGAKKISIKHPQLGVLRDYYFPVAIEPAKTYEMILITGEVQTVVKKSRTSQYVVFQLSPENAVVELDGELLETHNGTAEKLKNLGTYNYRVQAPNYLLEAGSVTIDDPQNKKIVTINLKPNFAHLIINVDNDAEIWINGELKGIGSWTGDLGAGLYEFEAKKEGYSNTYISREIVASPDQQIINLQTPSPIYGEINITSNPSVSDVYIDKKLYGQTPLYLSDLLIGKHNLRISHEGYGDFVSDITIEKGKICEINAELNECIYFDIKCNRPDADLYIDDVLMGKASGRRTILVGKHKIEVRPKPYEGLVAYRDVIDFKDPVEEVNVILEPWELKITFSSDMPNTYLFIDDEICSNSINRNPTTIKFRSGEHTLKFRCKGQNEIIKKVTFSSSNSSFFVSFKDKDIYIRN